MLCEQRPLAPIKRSRDSNQCNLERPNVNGI